MKAAGFESLQRLAEASMQVVQPHLLEAAALCARGCIARGGTLVQELPTPPEPEPKPNPNESRNPIPKPIPPSTQELLTAGLKPVHCRLIISNLDACAATAPPPSSVGIALTPG